MFAYPTLRICVCMSVSACTGTYVSLARLCHLEGAGILGWISVGGWSTCPHPPNPITDCLAESTDTTNDKALSLRICTDTRCIVSVERVWLPCLSQGSRYAVRCLELGPPWCQMEAFNNSLRFLYVVSGCSEVFTRAWTAHQQWSDDPIESDEARERRLEVASVDSIRVSGQRGGSVSLAVPCPHHIVDMALRGADAAS